MKYYKTNQFRLINAAFQVNTMKAQQLECSKLYAKLLSIHLSPCSIVVNDENEFSGLTFKSLDNPCFTKPDKYGRQGLRSTVAKKHKCEYARVQNIITECFKKSHPNLTNADYVGISILLDSPIEMGPINSDRGITFRALCYRISFKIINDNLMILMNRGDVEVHKDFTEITKSEYEEIKNLRWLDMRTNDQKDACVTWVYGRQAINGKQFGGFKSRAEEIGNLAKTICELAEEVPHLYLSMRIINKIHIDIFANDNRTGKQFEMDNSQNHGTNFIDFYHFVALVIDAKKAVSNEGN